MILVLIKFRHSFRVISHNSIPEAGEFIMNTVTEVTGMNNYC
jgi:hypothetical protein